MFWSLILTLLIITAVRNGQSQEINVSLPPRPYSNQPQCLTDHMTELQGWVNKNGYLTTVLDPQTTIDVSMSAAQDVIYSLTNQMQRSKNTVKVLSLARCNLKRVPAVFLVEDALSRSLAETLQYVTLYGNNFTDTSTPEVQYDMTLNSTDAFHVKIDNVEPVPTTWSAGFHKIKFTKLIELDLRMCSIETLSPNIFQEMLKLRVLYLSENKITTINPNAFYGLRNLVHLDLSRNFNRNQAMLFKSENLFMDMNRLRSLDLSYTKLADSNITVFTRLNKNFESISLCRTGISELKDCTFMNTSLKYIDISGNNGILKNHKVLKGTENTLRIIYASNVRLDTFKSFENLRELEILKLNDNEIPFLSPKVLKTLKNLKILDLAGNRLTSLINSPIIEANINPNLKYLSIEYNYINLITNEMMADFSKIKYLSLSGNFIVCNCNARELYEVALKNERNYTIELLIPDANNYVYKYTDLIYKTAFDYFNSKIINRNKISKECDHNKFPCEEFIENLSQEGDYVLLDYDQMNYHCLLPPEGQIMSFYDVKTCRESIRWAGDEYELLNQGRNELLSLIIIPALTLPMLIFAYIFRKNFKYCFVTVRNSALLSLINKEDVIDDGTIFNYDVFVSYCNDDRNWVLDQLLPNVEKDCNVSVCLHERDFEVGLSILENIVSCMDRSRSIMLIISKQFLLSQWCQFEMHLAQHRLLETRREDLILVLLEEIPRRARPTTLHYLMLTKTYIVWPKSHEEEAVFWRRLKRSLATYRLKQPGNESLA